MVKQIICLFLLNYCQNVLFTDRIADLGPVRAQITVQVIGADTRERGHNRSQVLATCYLSYHLCGCACGL